MVEDAFAIARRGLPAFVFVDETGKVVGQDSGGVESVDEVRELVAEHLGIDACERPDTPRDRCPGWLTPVVEAAASITVHELTRFMPPEDSDPRRGAVLMVFADRDADPAAPDDLAHRGELLLTERNHHMRSHPGQVSFPGGSLDEGETPVEAALREAHEEIGLVPAEVEVFGELPELWLPPSNFAVTPVLGYWRDRGEVRIESPDEVHEIHHVAIADLLDPDTASPSATRAAGSVPASSSAPDAT